MDTEDINIAEMEAHLKVVSAAKTAIENSLDDDLQSRSIIHNKIDSLDSIQPRINALRRGVAQLKSTTENAAGIADRVRGQVRVLDSAQARLSDAIDHVRNVLDLKQCLADVANAHEEGDYDIAIEQISRYVGLDPGTLGSEEEEKLKEAIDVLSSRVREKLNEATRVDEFDGIIKYSKLLAPLGYGNDGLDRYVKQIIRMLSQEADSDLKSLDQVDTEGGKQGGHLYVDAASRLFDRVAGLSEDHSPEIEKIFGPGHSISLLRGLQKQCDTQGAKLFDRYLRWRRLPARVREVRNALLYAEQTTSLDPRDLDPTLDEIALLSARAEIFDNYFRDKAREAVRAGEGEFDTDGLMHVSELNKRMQELLGAYLVLEEYYMRRSVSKAIANDAVDQDRQTSSMLDDSFYILRKCMRRALATRNSDSICAVLNHINDILTTEFVDALNAQFQERNARPSEVFVSEGGGSALFLPMTLNNMSIASEYAERLKSEGLRECEAVLKSQKEVSLVKVKTCLEDLGETSSSLKRNTEANLEMQFNTTLQPRIKPILDVLINADYELTDDQFERGTVTHATDVADKLKSVLVPFKDTLTEPNYELLASLASQFVARRMESLILQKRFTLLGGLQVDGDVRILSGFFAEMASRTTRPKFLRLTQMCSLLNLDSPTELLGYWGQEAGLMRWRLTASEVRRILSLRVDFSSEDISKLKLQ